MSTSTDLQHIPVVAQQTLKIFALLDAALEAKPYSLSFSECFNAGAGAAVKAWSEANKVVFHDSLVYADQSCDGIGYANLLAPISSTSTITVLRYRELTIEEIEARVRYLDEAAKVAAPIARAS